MTITSHKPNRYVMRGILSIMNWEEKDDVLHEVMEKMGNYYVAVVDEHGRTRYFGMTEPSLHNVVDMSTPVHTFKAPYQKGAVQSADGDLWEIIATKIFPVKDEKFEHGKWMLSKKKVADVYGYDDEKVIVMCYGEVLEAKKPSGFHTTTDSIGEITKAYLAMEYRELALQITR